MSRSIKLKCDFNDAATLEVEYRPDTWARVTYYQFRSCTGNRRIDGVLYNGPIYYEGTNHRYLKKRNEAFRLVGVEELNDKLRGRKKQEPETIRFYDRDKKYRD